MGCWNETCSITHLPIIENESVVMFSCKDENVLYGLTDADPMDYEQYISLYEFGTYNEYGYINEKKCPPDGQLRTFFVKKTVWDKLQETELPAHSTDYIDNIPVLMGCHSKVFKKKFKFTALERMQLLKILIFCRMTRRYFGICPGKGSQELSLKTHRKMLELADEELKILEKQYKDKEFAQ